MFEYEVKVCVDDVDLNLLRNKLNNLGFKFYGCWFEEDHYIDFRCCKCYVEDSALRIRKYDFNGNVKYKLTFKGPRMVEVNVKAREEIEMDLIDDTLLKIFGKLGFRDLIVKKVREKYSKGDLNIYIDDVDDLGRFIEIEIVNPPSIEVYEETLRELLSLLGLTGRSIITETYLEMLIKSKELNNSILS